MKLDHNSWIFWYLIFYFFLKLFTVGIFLTHAQLNIGVTFAKNSHQKSFILSACVDIKNILNSHHFAKNWEDAFQAMDFFFPVITELDMHLMVLNPWPCPSPSSFMGEFCFRLELIGMQGDEMPFGPRTIGVHQYSYYRCSSNFELWISK